MPVDDITPYSLLAGAGSALYDTGVWFGDRAERTQDAAIDTLAVAAATPQFVVEKVTEVPLTIVREGNETVREVGPELAAEATKNTKNLSDATFYASAAAATVSAVVITGLLVAAGVYLVSKVD